MRAGAALVSGMLAALGGCAAMPGLGLDPAEPGIAPPFPECRAASYAFAGRATFAELGLVGQSAAELPEPNRPAMIWVTRDPVPFDAAAPGGSRMLCFEFDDGSGGSEWPVNDAWQPPGAVASGAVASTEVNLAIPLLLAVVGTMVIGVIAFRRR